MILQFTIYRIISRRELCASLYDCQELQLICRAMSAFGQSYGYGNVGPPSPLAFLATSRAFVHSFFLFNLTRQISSSSNQTRLYFLSVSFLGASNSVAFAVATHTYACCFLCPRHLTHISSLSPAAAGAKSLFVRVSFCLLPKIGFQWILWQMIFAAAAAVPLP